MKTYMLYLYMASLHSFSSFFSVFIFAEKSSQLYALLFLGAEHMIKTNKSKRVFKEEC